MSITTGDFRQRITVHTLAEKKRKREPIVSLTAYDYATARLPMKPAWTSSSSATRRSGRAWL